MYFNVAVKELSARIIRYEIDDHSDPRAGIITMSSTSPWSDTSPWVASLITTVDIIAVHITGETNCAVIFWISNLNNMKCVAMKMDWMGVVSHQLLKTPFKQFHCEECL